MEFEVNCLKGRIVDWGHFVVWFFGFSHLVYFCRHCGKLCTIVHTLEKKAGQSCALFCS